MRLFTHNFLQCHVKGCTTNNFPLPLSEVELESRESEYNEQFMRNYLCKLDWPALLQTITSVSYFIFCTIVLLMMCPSVFAVVKLEKLG